MFMEVFDGKALQKLANKRRQIRHWAWLLHASGTLEMSLCWMNSWS